MSTADRVDIGHDRGDVLGLGGQQSSHASIVAAWLNSERDLAGIVNDLPLTVAGLSLKGDLTHAVDNSCHCAQVNSQSFPSSSPQASPRMVLTRR